LRRPLQETEGAFFMAYCFKDYNIH